VSHSSHEALGEYRPTNSSIIVVQFPVSF
jgi:hypothetical protein